MKLIDANLLESNLRAKAMECEASFPIMAKTFEAAADMVSAMPAAVDHKEQIDRAYKQGYLDGSVFALKKWGGLDDA